MLISKVVQNFILHILVFKSNIFDHLYQDYVSEIHELVQSRPNFFLKKNRNLMVDFLIENFQLLVKFDHYREINYRISNFLIENK